MAQSQYQEPIEKEDLDLAKKLKGNISTGSTEGPSENSEVKKPEIPVMPEVPVAEKNLEKEEIPPVAGIEKMGEAKEKEGEAVVETQEEKVGEKIETARKTIQTQKPAAATSVATDAQTVSGIAEYEKKVEKLIELALQKGPEHAIRVAKHLDKGKSVSEADNYTLDEVHDRMIEDELRKQLIVKGLLKEL